MSFRLVPKSVTLNNLEQCNGRIFCVISPNSVGVVANYVKWLISHQQIFCLEMS